MGTAEVTQSPIGRNLADAAKRIPSMRNGRPVHVATLTRWITDGAKLSNGSFLKLDAKRLPGRWVVTDEAVDQFIAALTADQSMRGEHSCVATQP